MASVCEHYDTHLAPYYDWVCGGREQKIEENRAFFSAYGIGNGQGKKALDLGCGSGFQAIPLAEIGYAVVAVDISTELLRQLREDAHASIVSVHSDILEFLQHNREQYALCVCMGDTLTHLAEIADVVFVLQAVYRSLGSDGVFIATFRDYSRELVGIKRFIPVRQSSDTVWTCFLEYSEKHVDVYDIVHRCIGEKWTMATSVYTKIRIPVEWMLQAMNEIGFGDIAVEKENGMVSVSGKKNSQAQAAESVVYR